MGPARFVPERAGRRPTCYHQSGTTWEFAMQSSQQNPIDKLAEEFAAKRRSGKPVSY